ncbi:hypothetical protein [Chitinophaga polysaccharea]|uniref:hypothetical protein n=1 Tax=Chitinophaga polysaccharea TaxID=1293035 RepID=UPI0011595E54|nr:hypothetical protein [Chitinophaga polysaccharea]
MKQKKQEQQTNRPQLSSATLPPGIKGDEEMTPELLRKFPGCEHYTDEQAKEIVFTIKQLAELLYDLALPKELHNVDCQ